MFHVDFFLTGLGFSQDGVEDLEVVRVRLN